MMTLIIIIQQEKNVLIVFDDIIADIMANKIFQITIKELFIRCRKLNISLVFITQSYFLFQHMLYWIQLIIWLSKLTAKENYKILQCNHSAYIDYKDFVKIYRECTKESYLFFTIDTTYSSWWYLKVYKKSFGPFIKMKLTDGIKILDDKIKAIKVNMI